MPFIGSDFQEPCYLLWPPNCFPADTFFNKIRETEDFSIKIEMHLSLSFLFDSIRVEQV